MSTSTDDRKIYGFLHKVFETTQISVNFKKREFVIKTDEQYPQLLRIEFTQDKCELLNSYNIGDQIEICINIRGREWINPEGKAIYFNTFQAWRIQLISATGHPEPAHERQNHIKNSMHFPPAHEVFGDEPYQRPAATKPTFTQQNYDLTVDDENWDLPF